MDCVIVLIAPFDMEYPNRSGIPTVEATEAIFKITPLCCSTIPGMMAFMQ